jgi:hypothetical protein
VLFSVLAQNFSKNRGGETGRYEKRLKEGKKIGVNRKEYQENIKKE